MFHLLPSSLLLYLVANIPLVFSQAPISLDSLRSFTSKDFSTVDNSLQFTFPRSSSLTISVSLCQFQARIFVTNSTDSTKIEVPITDGLVSFTGQFNDAGVLSVETDDLKSQSGTIQIGISEKGSLQERLSNFPLVGDTTSNQAIIFTPPFLEQSFDEPSYPNYTLPITPTFNNPTQSPKFTVVVTRASDRPQAGCIIQNRVDANLQQGQQGSLSLWLRDVRDGWREQLVVDGLTPATNYTAFFVQDSNKLSGPSYFVTKSSAFQCPLVHSLSFCPGISYAVPLPPPAAPATIYNETNIPKTISGNVTEIMTNFTTSLKTFACGRDFYSPIKLCSDCQREYRKWLCAIAFPRCGEATTTTSTQSDGPVSALAPQASGAPSRSPFFDPFDVKYDQLLPCIETCQSVDRACPAALGFKCPPTVRFADIAKQSYGIGIVDGMGYNQERLGSAGLSSDIWGNTWCNG